MILRMFFPHSTDSENEHTSGKAIMILCMGQYKVIQNITVASSWGAHWNQNPQNISESVPWRRKSSTMLFESQQNNDMIAITAEQKQSFCSARQDNIQNEKSWIALVKAIDILTGLSEYQFPREEKMPLVRQRKRKKKQKPENVQVNHLLVTLLALALSEFFDFSWARHSSPTQRNREGILCIRQDLLTYRSIMPVQHFSLHLCSYYG